MNIRDIQRALIESADLVALAVCRRNSPKSDTMTTREMYAEYNHGWLDYNITHGNLVGRKAGAAKNSPILWSRLEVEALLRADRIGAKLK